MRILLCFGTRPEAIKMAPVIKELEIQKQDFKICVTSQHREMLDQVLQFFEIEPDYDLDLMKPGQSLNSLSALIIAAIDNVLMDYDPQLVLVQGDTTTAAVVALAAFHRSIKVGHVEAGLRTHIKRSPFPEEMNRQLIGRIADIHFAPTERTASNLLKENVPADKIILTGNTVVDALFWAVEKLKDLPDTEEIKNLKKLIIPGKRIILVTGHRRENFGNGLKNICAALNELAKRGDVQIIYPVHLNPNVIGPVTEILANHRNIDLIRPVAYPAMLWLMEKACIIISDSGGIQEEAPSFKKPVIVTRDFTERLEGVEEGFCFLTGTDTEKIIFRALKLLDQSLDLSNKENPYGDGKASKKIVDALRG